MTEMKIGYFPHEHPLFLSSNVDRFDYDCFVCKQPVLDTPYYSCSECKEVVIHKLCGELKKEIQHPFHPLQPLILRSRPPYKSDKFICKACRKRGSGFVYNCAHLQFDLHIQCAFLVPTFSYGGHPHLLTLFETNFERKKSQRCVCCDTHCYNSFFRCVECNYNIHKSCAADDLPKHIFHPFHPPHSLTRINDDPDPFVCNGCLAEFYTAYFSCAKCSFKLCEKCYLLVPTIKYQGHHHLLTLFPKVNFSIYQTCHSCCEKLLDYRFIFRCVECNFNLHSYCHPSFPNTIKHDHDIHPCKKLIFKRSPLKDEEDSNQFSCDACEKERSPIDPFFYCAECHFLAEIGCVIDEILPSLSTENPPKTVVKPTKIGYFPHEHPLFLSSINVDRLDYDHCSVCRQPVSEIGTECYSCNKCQEVVIHKLCGELEEEIQHPFHPLHPLILRSRTPYRSNEFGCNACRKPGTGFVYHCAECEFDLDIQCVSLVPTFSYGGHHHLLTLFEHNGNSESNPRCVCCDTDCYNYFFRCVECNYNIHKSCAADLPKHILHPFHPPHPLTRINDDPKWFVCDGCLDDLQIAYFSCAKCSFKLCENCYLLVPTIKYQGHPHLLTLFPKVNFPIYEKCDSCGKSLWRSSFLLRCVECKFNLHFQCHPMFPHTIKHGCHIGPLILRESPLKEEEGFTEFYCDACEKERNPYDPVFYCAECEFAAEIGCVIDEILPSLSVENPPKIVEISTLEDVQRDDFNTEVDESTKEELIIAMPEKLEAELTPDPTTLIEINEEIAKIDLEINALTARREILQGKLQHLEDLTLPSLSEGSTSKNVKSPLHVLEE